MIAVTSINSHYRIRLTDLL